MLDSLIHYGEAQEPGSSAKTKEEQAYYAREFIQKFGKHILSNNLIIEEVDLESQLKPIILTLFWGNNVEKKKAKELLSELQDLLKEEELKRQEKLIDWLFKVEHAFPRLLKIVDKFQLNSKVRKGVFPTIPLSLKDVGVVATIIGAVVAVTGFVINLVQLVH